MQRYGMITGLRVEKVDEYKKLHAAVWSDVLKMISACNICNYSIYLHRMPNGQHLLFSYFEYAGNDFAADMAKMAADETTRKWWELTDPCQEAVAEAAVGNTWATMPEIFHHD
ncbi:MAG: L-rhamnose mutarotase [Oceanipulchritudo sp.]